jgi:hypothetical protein
MTIHLEVLGTKPTQLYDALHPNMLEISFKIGTSRNKLDLVTSGQYISKEK